MIEPLPHRLRSPILGLLALVTLASLLGTALSPYLLVKSPLLLVGFSPAAHHIALAAATEEPLPLITIATLRRTLTSVATFGLGALYGPAAVTFMEQRYPRLGRLVKALQSLFARWGMAVLLLAPIPAVCLLAGAARSRLLVFLPTVVLALALWNSVSYALGDALSRWTELLRAFLDEHLLESTLICAALVLLQQGYVRLAKLRRDNSAG